MNTLLGPISGPWKGPVQVRSFMAHYYSKIVSEVFSLLRSPFLLTLVLYLTSLSALAGSFWFFSMPQWGWKFINPHITRKWLIVCPYPFAETGVSNQVLTVGQPLIHVPLRVDSALSTTSTTKAPIQIHLSVLLRSSHSVELKIRIFFFFLNKDPLSSWWTTNSLKTSQAVFSMPLGGIQELVTFPNSP